jgi:hypothetical protein
MSAFTFSITPVDSEPMPGEARDGLRVQVPEFVLGPYPPEFWICEPLLTDTQEGNSIPFFAEASLIRNSLVNDEVEFRQSHLDDWYERCWFIVGNVIRNPSGKLWGHIQRIIEARNIASSCFSFAFGPDTWRMLYEEIDYPNEIVLGWVHTHSLDYLRQDRDVASAELPARRGDQCTCEVPQDNSGNEFMDLSDGLFLSEMDIESATTRGFNAAYQLTCVVDSDACAAAEDNSKLGDMFGVWGYVDTILNRRSINIIKDQK